MKYEVKTEIDTKDLKGRRIEFDWGWKKDKHTGTILDVIPAGYKATPNQLQSFYGIREHYDKGMIGPNKTDRVLVKYFDSKDEENHFIVIPLSHGGLLYWNLI